jgi:hypothetical protein
VRQGLLQPLQLPLGLEQVALAGDPLQLEVQPLAADAAFGAAQGVVPQQLLLHHLLDRPEQPERGGVVRDAGPPGGAGESLQEGGWQEVRLHPGLLGHPRGGGGGLQALLLLEDPSLDCGRRGEGILITHCFIDPLVSSFTTRSMGKLPSIIG